MSTLPNLGKICILNRPKCTANLFNGFHREYLSFNGLDLKDLKDSKLILNESKLFRWSSRISLVPFRTFRGPLFLKPITGQELFLAVSYSKPALVIVIFDTNNQFYERNSTENDMVHCEL